MIIENPFNKIEHKVYKYTFLHNVTVNISFASGSVSPQEYWKAVTAFLSKYFPSVGTPKIESDLIGSLKLTSVNKQMEFTFMDGNISVNIAHTFYKSFKETIEPALGVLISYLQDVVKLKTIDSLSIHKVNVWPIKMESETENYKDVIAYVFNSNIAKGFVRVEDLNIKDEQAFKLSRETEISLGEQAKLKGKIIVDFQSLKNFNIFLKCKTEANNVDVEEIVSVAKDLNAVQFDFFHEMVSENVIAIMEKGGE